MGEFDFVVARRTGLKLRMGIMGPPGSGKSMTSLYIATGVAPGQKIAFIDTENRRGLEYADRFQFHHMDFKAPYSPARYIEAIAAAARFVGDGVVIVDSMSHAWMGKGGVLDIKAKAGSDFSGWKVATPEHTKLMEAIMACPAHIIVTMRVKTQYEMEEYRDRNGQTRTKPVKVGLAPIQRAEAEYEFSILGAMDMRHQLTVTKASFDVMDQTFDRPGFSFGDRIRNWLESSVAAEDAPDAVPPPAQPTPAPVSRPAATGPVLRQEPPGQDWSKPWADPGQEASRPAATPDPAAPAQPKPAPAAIPRGAVDDKGLPVVKVPPGQVAGAPPTKEQLGTIAQLLGKLGYNDEIAGRVEVYRLLRLTVPPEGPTLKAIPTWYEAAQIVKYLSDELNARNARRSA